MSDLKDMPVVTVEQVVRFREKALEVEQQRDKLLEAAKNLRDVKGRYHTEQAMMRLVDAIAEVEEEK